MVHNQGLFLIGSQAYEELKYIKIVEKCLKDDPYLPADKLLQMMEKLGKSKRDSLNKFLIR
jgi:uncharacterized protein YneF (UPF0154 family)